MTERTAATALRLSRTMVAQFLSGSKRLSKVLATDAGKTTLLVRAEPVWEGEPVLSLTNGRTVRVLAAPSPLAVHETVLEHAREIDPEPRILVILTDVEDHDLDPGILARTHRGRPFDVDRWDIVRETFGATAIDPRLKRHDWACEALLDAAGAQRWPTALAGGLLARASALSALTARRLQLDEIGDRVDPATLLDWSQRPGGPQLLLDLRGPERDGIVEFLSEEEQSGPTGRMLAALARTGHGAEAVAYGLVCAALWKHATPSNTVYQARGRVERWLGDRPPVPGEALDRQLADFGDTCEQYVRTLLHRARRPVELQDEADESAQQARKIANTVLAQADLLVRQFGASEAATTSPILTAGLEARFTAAGHALGRKQHGDLERKELDAAVEKLRGHDLARDHAVRISRVRMAQRLTRWLRSEPDPTALTVADSLARHMQDTAWADRALDYVEAGGDDDPTVRVAYQTLTAEARELRREFDRQFAKTLAIWTESGTGPGSMLTVETFLHRIVRPAAATHRVLLIVVDGMSAAIATELAGELRKSLNEYDPLPVDGTARRRAMAAALPSLTAVSRTSLFAGTLMKGDQKVEQRLFPEHSFWGAKKAKVFHKNDLRSEPGDRFGKELHAALDNPEYHVAVVLNTIDDRLAKEHKLDDSGWEAREIGDLQALVGYGASRGMAVLITSDHGHVIDRHGATVKTAGFESARHRLPAPEHDRLAETEIALSGPRVVWPQPGASIVALWDNDSHYTAQKAGYHGGAALAEITIPILAFMPRGAELPTGWQEQGEQRPAWWKDNTEPIAAAPAPIPAKRVGPKVKQMRENQMSLDIPIAEPDPIPAQSVSNGDGDLVSRLLTSVIFEAQLEQLARKQPIAKLEKAIRALLEGPLPSTALAQRIGDPPSRASGFAAILGQLLNVDGIQVLETDSDGRTLKLNIGLLSAQFGLR